MKFKKLGNTELSVSTICLGSMTWGGQVDEKSAHEQMDFATEEGVNFFDTAEMYASPCSKNSFGKTEKIIGNWFKKKRNRQKTIVATKISGPGQPWVRKGGPQYTETNISTAIDGSLKRLQTDYIDLYQLHWPDRFADDFGQSEIKYSKSNFISFESILHDLKKFVDQGKIRHIGICNETAEGLLKFIEISKAKDLPKISSIQNCYNLLNRSFENDLAEVSIKEKISLIAYSPLAFGILTGKYRNNIKPKNSRLKLYEGYFTRYNSKLSTLAAEEYFKISKKYKIKPGELSLAFANQQNFVTSNIIGATTVEQLKENINSINLNLSTEILEELNSVHIKNPNPAKNKSVKRQEESSKNI